MEIKNGGQNMSHKSNQNTSIYGQEYENEVKNYLTRLQYY